jgi:hypothetical protein
MRISPKFRTTLTPGSCARNEYATHGGHSTAAEQLGPLDPQLDNGCRRPISTRARGPEITGISGELAR